MVLSAKTAGMAMAMSIFGKLSPWFPGLCM
jgi:hypothetical protein